MATKTKRRRKAKGGKPRYGTKAYFRYIGKKGGRKTARKSRRKALKARGLAPRRVRRRFYPSKTYVRGKRKGQHYRPIAVRKYSTKNRSGKRRRYPTVKWSGRKGTRRYNYTTIGRGKNKRGYFTNPRRNPKGIAALPGQYIGGFTGSLQRIPKLFKGKNAPKNIAFTAGGAVATYIAGGYVAKFLNPVLDRVPASTPTSASVSSAA